MCVNLYISCRSSWSAQIILNSSATAKCSSNILYNKNNKEQLRNKQQPTTTRRTSRARFASLLFLVVLVVPCCNLLLLLHLAALRNSRFFVHFMTSAGYIYFTHMSKAWCNPCWQWYGMDCVGTCFAYAQSVLLLLFVVQSGGGGGGASVRTLHVVPNLVCTHVHRCYGMELLRYIHPHMSKPNVTRVQSATEWTASDTYFTHVQT